MDYNIQDINSIDWSQWQPTEEATLCFIRKKSRILLMLKKTGMGTGLINAPGGRIEKGESPESAAIRETQEEVLVTPLNLKKTGLLYFQFTDGYKLLGHVFVADDYQGEPGTTPEADPFWVKESKIPYNRMWEDDQYWIPHMLKGRFIRGYFIFDRETMHAFRIEG